MKIAVSSPPVEEKNVPEQDDDIASALNDLQVRIYQRLCGTCTIQIKKYSTNSKTITNSQNIKTLYFYLDTTLNVYAKIICHCP